jgi:cobalt-zinc-cadmium efflux system outer membrane protein
MARRVLLLLVAGVTVAPAIARGDALSVDDAIAAAEAHAAPVAEASARVEQARGRRITAGLRLPSRPELEATVQSDLLTQREGERTIEASLRQELELFGQRGLRMRVADAEVKGAELGIDDVRREIRGATRAAYYELMFQERRTALAAEAVEGATRVEEAARRRVAAGDLGESEWHLLVADLAEARADLRAGEAEQKVARARLDRLMGGPPRGVTATIGEFPVLEELPAGDLLATSGATDRSDLRAARAEIDAAQAEVSLRSRERLPNVTLVVGYAYERGVLGADDFESAVITRAVVDADHLFTVGLSIPLPWFRSNRGDVAEARGRTHEAEARRVGVEARVREEIVAAVARYDAARVSTAGLGEAETVVATSLERFERAWADKQIELAEYLAVRDRVLRVRRSALEARRDGAIAAAELEAALGQPIPSAEPDANGERR